MRRFLPSSPLARILIRAMSTSQASIKQSFFAQPHFAVVGASKDEQKWGTKVRLLLSPHPPSR
jgi:hypothetical protein